jgi:predicted nucleic acid-binding protein
VSSETLICDTSFVGHFMRRQASPDRYSHWDDSVMDRVEAGTLAISIVTIAEARAGFVNARWGRLRVAREELRLAEFPPVLIDDPHVSEWARLWIAVRRRGISLTDNDLWIAATASVRSRALVTCDRDHLRIAGDLPVEVVYLQPPV